jgi:hypothetical protein
MAFSIPTAILDCMKSQISIMPSAYTWLVTLKEGT